MKRRKVPLLDWIFACAKYPYIVGKMDPDDLNEFPELQKAINTIRVKELSLIHI